MVERLEVQRAVAAPAAEIFAVLTDPRGHVTIDSSGMLMEASGDVVARVGDTFVVHMDREALNDYPLGRYDVTVEIVTFEPDREIAWTVHGQLRTSATCTATGWSRSRTGTLVTSYYDWSTVEQSWKDAAIFPVIPESALRATLGILARTVAPGKPRPESRPIRFPFPRARARRGRAIYNQGMETPDDGQDMIGQRDDRRDRPTLVSGTSPTGHHVLAVAALAVGLIAGYLGGHQQARTPVPTAVSADDATAAIAADHRAELSQPGAGADRHRQPVRAAAREDADTRGRGRQPVDPADCRGPVPGRAPAGRAAGEPPPRSGRAARCTTGAPFSPALAAGATEWLTITFDVLVRCPQPLPVQFAVSYTRSGKAATAQFDEFSDLGEVTYSGCPADQ